MKVTKDNANRIIFTSSYGDKQQGLVDAMLCTWAELEQGEYGFTGYEYTYKAISRLTDEQAIEVASAILDRKADRVAA